LTLKYLEININNKKRTRIMKGKIKYFFVFALTLFVFASVFPMLNVSKPLHADSTSDVNAFVTRFYQQCLGRQPDAEGLAGWVNALLNHSITGATVANGFINSPEFISRNLPNDAYLLVMYKAFFDRDPDPQGYSNWMGQLNSGSSRQFILVGFVNSTEFANLCAKFGIGSGSISGSSSGSAASTSSAASTGGMIPIFAFHSVMPGSGYEYEISTGQLNELCSLLKQRGYQTISFQDLFASVNGGKALPPKPVILTSDDGYQSVYQYAFPIIQSYGYRMTLFLSTDYIGSSDGDRRTNSFDAGSYPTRAMLVWPEIVAMVSAGFEIQSHGTDHGYLGSMSYAQDLAELQNSKAIIQSFSGGVCNVAAWPFNSFSASSVRALTAAGYGAGVAYNGGSLNTAVINWGAMPRIPVQADTSISSLAGYLP
jgi:peptidoglycan/xylan/chitin deacetylase (PgdA/CDA1 family)